MSFEAPNKSRAFKPTYRKWFFSPKPVPCINNEYVSSFYEALHKETIVVDYKDKSISRSIDIIKSCLGAEVMVLNWPEDIGNTKYGFIQVLLSICGVLIFKIRNGFLIWVCHNKKSHTIKFKYINQFLRRFYFSLSDKIIVHSSDAIDQLPKSDKITFFNHPVYNSINGDKKCEDNIDVLVWGSIEPYKGILELIEQYKKHHQNFRLKVIGKAQEEYFSKLLHTSKELNIHLENRFINSQELDNYFAAAKIILLPYSHSDTFSSGSLIHSLNARKIIIGPSLGNFLDLEKCSACLTYKDYRSLFYLINKLLMDKSYYDITLKQMNIGASNYIKDNSWDLFAKRLVNSIRKHRKFYSSN